MISKTNGIYIPPSPSPIPIPPIPPQWLNHQMPQGGPLRGHRRSFGPLQASQSAAGAVWSLAIGDGRRMETAVGLDNNHARGQLRTCHVCMYVCMHVCMYAWMDGWMYACMHACMHVYYIILYYIILYYIILYYIILYYIYICTYTI